MHDQLKDLYDKILSKHQCGFRKGFDTQHCLLAMIEQLRKSLDRGAALAAILIDLSKALDYLPHNLLTAKLHAYGIKEGSLNLLFSYHKTMNGCTLNLMCLKDLYLALCYLIYFYAISFCFSMTFP